MRTLDDVINDFEICQKASLNLSSCSGCSYANDHDVYCRSHIIADVLYCLKKCRAEQHENDPLTLEELHEKYRQLTEYLQLLEKITDVCHKHGIGSIWGIELPEPEKIEGRPDFGKELKDAAAE